MVYGVAGQPQIEPTAWALVALRENSQRAENQQSLAWLAGSRDSNRSPESLALSHIALELYGKADSAWAETLYDFTKSEAEPWSVPAVAWMMLAFSESSRWLGAEFAAQSNR